MSDDSDEDLELRRALGALPRDIPAPGDLEDRTVSALRRAGALPQPAPRVARASRLAAAVVLVVAGYAWGASAHRFRDVREGPRYVLLLREDGGFRPPAAGSGSLVPEYRDWAARLRSERRLVAGEELDPAAVLLPADVRTEPPGARVAGFFIITARDDQEALAVAQTCPHLRHGGLVEVRRIHPT